VKAFAPVQPEAQIGDRTSPRPAWILGASFAGLAGHASVLLSL
jgi:hypothetical protein